MQITVQDMDKIFCRLVEVVNSACGANNSDLLKKHLRISKKGNIVLGSQAIFNKKLIDKIAESSVEDVTASLNLLDPTCSRKIMSWVKQAEKGINSNIKPLQIDDIARWEKLSDDNKAMFIDEFLAMHCEYASRLEADAIATFGAIPDMLPKTIRDRMKCSPSTDAVSISVQKLFSRHIVARWNECVCGFATVLSEQKKKPVVFAEVVIADNRAMYATLQEHVFGSKDEHEQLARRVLQAYDQANQLVAKYHVAPEASYAKEKLAAFSQAVYDGKIIRSHGGWRIGEISIDNPSAKSIAATADGLLSIIESGKGISKDIAREIVKDIWLKHVEPACHGYDELYADLPSLGKVSGTVERAYLELKKFIKDWSSGVVENNLAIGRYSLHNIDPDKVRNDAINLCNNFRAIVENFQRKFGSKDQRMINTVLRLIAANPGKMGVTTVAAVLAGSRSKKVMERHLNRFPEYGLFAGFTQEVIAATVAGMVFDGLLSVKYVTSHHLPVLHVPKAVVKALQDCQPTSTVEFDSDPPAMPDHKEKQMRKPPPPATVDEAIQRRSWDALADMSEGGDWAAEVALNVAAALWPTGKAGKIVKAQSKQD